MKIMNSSKKVKIYLLNFNDKTDIISFIKYIKEFPKIRIESISSEEPYYY